MTPDRKLLILGVGFLAACGIGAQSLLAMSDSRSESGFDGDDPFPLVSTTTPSPPIEFDVPMSSRNPFEFVAVGSDAERPAAQETTTSTTSTVTTDPDDERGR